MGARSMENWEIAAREGVRDRIAAYTHSGDRFLMEAYADCFLDDGVLAIRGQEPLVGRQAIFDYFTNRPATSSSPTATIMRHNITNILFDEVTPELVRVGSYFTVFTNVGLDHMGRYRDEMVPDGDVWRIKHRFVSVDWNAPASLMIAAAEPAS